MSHPSYALAASSLKPASAANVKNQSSEEVSERTTLFGATTPGQRTIAGTRTPPGGADEGR